MENNIWWKLRIENNKIKYNLNIFFDYNINNILKINYLNLD